MFSINQAIGEGRQHHIGVVAFDLLIDDGVDLRGLPLTDRKLRLDSLVSRAAIPSLSYVAPHPDGARLFATIDELGLEGVVSKRAASTYRSGRRGEWVKVKSRSGLQQIGRGGGRSQAQDKSDPY